MTDAVNPIAVGDGAAEGGSDLCDVGIIGGSGFYTLLNDASTVPISTPWGETSAPLSIGELAGRRVAFLPRHGVDHRFPPHRVPYRANLWALRAVGARQIVAASAVGGLRPDHGPGTFVVPDQILDRTSGRAHTYNDADSGVVHIPFSDPYSLPGRQAAIRASARISTPVVDSGTLVVINGPRFSTRAESLYYQRCGATIIGMTAMPEAGLARELAMEYTGLCMVTDLDAGVEAASAVTHEQVLEQFAANLPRLKELLVATVAELPVIDGQSMYTELYGRTPPAFRLP